MGNVLELELKPKLKMVIMSVQKPEQTMVILIERKPELKMGIMAGAMAISLHLEDQEVITMLKMEIEKEEETSIT